MGKVDPGSHDRRDGAIVFPDRLTWLKIKFPEKCSRPVLVRF